MNNPIPLPTDRLSLIVSALDSDPDPLITVDAPDLRVLIAEVLTLREQRKALTDYISAEDTGALLNEVVVLREQRDKVLALADDLDALALPMESDPDTEVARATSVGISFAYSHAAQKLRRALTLAEEAETDE